MKIEFSTLYWDNTPVEQMSSHRSVMEHCDLPVRYYEENTPHGLWLNRICMESNADVIGFFDADCVPLSRDKVLEAINYVLHADSFIGVAQASNHIYPKSHIYAAPAFFLITRSCYERLGRPSFMHNPRADVGEEISYIAEAVGQRYRCLYPQAFEREPVEGLWPLGNYGYYGIGTVFDDTVYHLYQGRMGNNQELFIRRCQEIVEGRFSTNGFYPARVINYPGRIVR